MPLEPSNLTREHCWPLKQGCSPAQNLLNSQIMSGSSWPKERKTMENSRLAFLRPLSSLKKEGIMLNRPSVKRDCHRYSSVMLSLGAESSRSGSFSECCVVWRSSGIDWLSLPSVGRYERVSGLVTVISPSASSEILQN